MPLIGRGADCWLCVAEGNIPAAGQFRAGICSRHWYREAYFGRLDPDPECWPVGEEPWEDAAQRELASLRFFNPEEWTA